MSAAGILLAFAVIIGAVIGIFQGQPSIGFLSGLGVGIILAILATLIQNRRKT
ncbi:hypothetical protein KCG44_05225 [Pacificimonas sp. WHA3]|uniref:Uncharacterized protein n=1 Tax=Pacificimonas pallii TaxID=2827236 RepID=A0ABS6SCN4_9SPHN|nr:hypothetical protein [Pacificimonas pallii]MBV7256182.1 hypothetical protein [Pacificimonas pallii]